MNKAFIFDMDGVLVNSEQVWSQDETNFHNELFGEEIAQKIGKTIGMSLNTLYDKAVEYGFSMNKNEYILRYDTKAASIYQKVKITDGVEQLAQKLIELEYKLGVVSSSRRNWIDKVINRLSFKHNLEYIISITDRPDLPPKPNPDAYLDAIKHLHASPATTIILEDSNSGIQAAKASGAFTIGFRGSLVSGYKQTGADVYADTMEEVIKIVESREDNS